MTQDVSQWIPAPMTDIDFELSRRTKRAVRARMKRCYYNAWRALIGPALPELTGALYVEGHAVARSDHVVEHGWLELAGRIVETTNLAQGIPSFQTYYPGLKYTQDQAQRLAREVGEVPFAWQMYGWGGYDHPAMLGSFIAAWEELHPGAMLARYSDRLAELAANWQPQEVTR